MATVVQDWLSGLPWKQQSIFFSGLRGPDAANVPNIKIVNRWMRIGSQHNADPSKDYMKSAELPPPLEVCKELEFLPCHYVHHFADALAVIAYSHPCKLTSEYAAKLHYTIAEELFHFRPEQPAIFVLRHRDKPNGHDESIGDWNRYYESTYTDYLRDAQIERIRTHAKVTKDAKD